MRYLTQPVIKFNLQKNLLYEKAFYLFLPIYILRTNDSKL
jgi:hypothetical protein